MKKKNRLFVLLVAALVCLVCILSVCFWDVILIFLAPKAVLTEALTSAVSQLDVRFRYSPVRNLLDLYSAEGRYTLALSLETDTELLGPAAGKFLVHTDISDHRLLAEGNVRSAGVDLNLSLFADGEFMAVSSQELVNGKFYGITYDSFEKDLDRFPLIKFLIPSEMIQKWNGTVSEIKQLMNRPYHVPQLTSQDVRVLMTGVMLLDSKVGRAVYNDRNCYTISYQASGEEVRDLLSEVLDIGSSQTAEISCSFFLYEGSLLCVKFTGTAGDNSLVCTLNLGEDCHADDISFSVSKTENANTSTTGIVISTADEPGTYNENVRFRFDDPEKTIQNQVAYSWDYNTGDMILTWNQGIPLQMNVSRDEDGLCVTTDDFAQLADIFAGGEGNTLRDISGTMILNPGSAIDKPEYVPMSQWSSEDLMILVKGLGSLIGIHF